MHLLIDWSDNCRTNMLNHQQISGRNVLWLKWFLVLLLVDRTYTFLAIPNNFFSFSKTLLISSSSVFSFNPGSKDWRPSNNITWLTCWMTLTDDLSLDMLSDHTPLVPCLFLISSSNERIYKNEEINFYCRKKVNGSIYRR